MLSTERPISTLPRLRARKSITLKPVRFAQNRSILRSGSWNEGRPGFQSEVHHIPQRVTTLPNSVPITNDQYWAPSHALTINAKKAARAEATSIAASVLNRIPWFGMAVGTELM